MRHSVLFSLAFVGVGVAEWAGSFGAEPTPPIETILARWEQASRDIRTLDAAITRLSYDVVSTNPDRPESCRGRLYFEAPNRGRYEVRGTHGSDVVIWTGTEVVWIEQKMKRYCSWSLAEIEGMRKRADESARKPSDQSAKGSDWQRFPGFFASLERFLPKEPEELLPGVVNADTEALRKRFGFKLQQRSDTKIELTGLAGQNRDGCRFREIGILLDPESYLVHAIRTTEPTGRKVVHIFEDIKVNLRPPDRDAIMKPDLTGLTSLR